MINLSIKKVAIYGIASVVAVLVLLNVWTTVPAGHVKVQTMFGKVVDEPLTEGFHVVNPLKSFDLLSTRNDKYEINGLNIPTQDRFESTGNVTVLYRIDGAKGNYIKSNYGTAEEYIDKTLRQQLRSIVRNEGRKLKDSRSLAQAESISLMQSNTLKQLTLVLDGTGIELQEVLVQDIQFDPRIAQQILATQTRIQKEEEQKSQERIAITNALIAKAEAEGEANKKREAADAEAYKLTTEANAHKDAAIAKAQGDAEAIKLIADANLQLTKSLTPQILEKQRLDNEAILYSKSKGNVPTTIIGETNLRAIGVPISATAN